MRERKHRQFLTEIVCNLEIKFNKEVVKKENYFYENPEMLHEFAKGYLSENTKCTRRPVTEQYLSVFAFESLLRMYVPYAVGHDLHPDWRQEVMSDGTACGSEAIIRCVMETMCKMLYIFIIAHRSRLFFFFQVPCIGSIHDDLRAYITKRIAKMSRKLF